MLELISTAPLGAVGVDIGIEMYLRCGAPPTVAAKVMMKYCPKMKALGFLAVAGNAVRAITCWPVELSDI
jgi:hypothetical protein